jgi:hypothetical protein
MDSIPLAVRARNRNQAPKAASITILFSGYYLLRSVVPRILLINFYAKAAALPPAAPREGFWRYKYCGLVMELGEDPESCFHWKRYIFK